MKAFFVICVVALAAAATQARTMDRCSLAREMGHLTGQGAPIHGTSCQSRSGNSQNHQSKESLHVELFEQNCLTYSASARGIYARLDPQLSFGYQPLGLEHSKIEI